MVETTIQRKTFKCECGKEYTSQGSLNLHKYHCGMKEYREQRKIKTKPVEQGCNGGCTWRLLNQSNGLENQAIKQGYMEVCSKCQELQ